MRPIRCSLSTSRCLRVRPRPLVFPLHPSRSKPRFVSQSLRLLAAKSHPFVDLFRHPSFPNLFPTPTSFPLPPSPQPLATTFPFLLPSTRARPLFSLPLAIILKKNRSNYEKKPSPSPSLPEPRLPTCYGKSQLRLCPRNGIPFGAFTLRRETPFGISFLLTSRRVGWRG